MLRYTGPLTQKDSTQASTGMDKLGLYPHKLKPYSLTGYGQNLGDLSVPGKLSPM